MTDAADLVMPKLGLTMTEGRIARWAVAAGAPFAKGDCIVEIETDKIVNEVEAPADGTLLSQLVPAGETVAVGTPIARWSLAGGQNAAASVPPSSDRPTAAGPTPVAQSRPSIEPRGQRIVATPYARKRAREAGLALDGIAGSGPGGRIKAGDVERAVQHSASGQSLPAMTRMDAAAPSPVAPSSFSVIVLDFDASRLIEIARSSVRAGRNLSTERLAVIAALRALEAIEPARTAFVFGLGDLARLTTISAAPGTSGAYLLSQLSSDGAGGDVAIVEARDGERLWAPEVPDGWRAVLVVGASRPTACPAADGGIIWREFATITLGYAVGRLPHATARSLVADVRDAFEDPLHLLAS